MAILWTILALFLTVYLCNGSTINKALDRPTKMSSRYSSRSSPGGYLSSEAVDGDVTASNPRIIHTAIRQTFAWWTVDLEETVQDPFVRIYFRVDGGNIWRRNGVQLYTSTTPFSSYPGTQDQLCFTVKGRADSADIPSVLDKGCRGTWQYLMVYTDTKNNRKDSGPMLDFGEIQVLVCSDSGTYGVNCRSCSARQCAISSSSCDRYTGECLEGCQAGWMGTDCTQKCSSGQYGVNCSNYCTYRYCTTSTSTCDRITGICPRGCLSGYEGKDCTEKCRFGTYGPGCNLSCGDRKCLSSTSSCDHVTGRCDRECQSGWDGIDCTQKCSEGTYGPGCNLFCDNRKCSSISSCHHVTGRCDDGCKAGWNGTDCTQTCSSDMYGANCAKSCSSRHCVVTSATCDRFNGRCSPAGCQAGWRGLDCMEGCSSGTYGRNCTNRCDSRQCAVMPTTCNRVSGKCPTGCSLGWREEDCTKECQFDRYGDSCAKNCSSRNCLTPSDTCHHVTGACDGGACVTGWEGTDCSQAIFIPPPTSMTPAVVGTVVVLILVIVVIVVVVIIYKRRRRSTSHKQVDQRGKQSVAALNGSQANRPSNDEMANVYVNMELAQDELDKKQKLKPMPSPKLPSKGLADIEQEEEVPEDDEPSPSRDYYNEDEEVIREIPVSDLAATIQKLKQREGGFAAEYGRLPTGFIASYADSQKPENAGKNKFKGYYPYDNNRVRLSPLPKVPGSDYINASLMHNYDKRKRYIASQAPNKKTVGDFWRMIWERHCGRIIMLTGLVEATKVKCYQYWPKDGVLETDQFRVEVKVTDTRANYTIRHLKVTLKEGGKHRTVVQYHYTSWPDHGVPDTLALVQFMWMIRRSDTSTEDPLLVHCSAGIGRTGTYIAIDSLLDQARNEGMVDVQGYVTAMRGERKNMIQTKDQYECVFNCLVEMTTFGNTSMDVENFTTSYSSRGIDSMVDRKTMRELIKMMTKEDRTDPSARHRVWVDGNQDFIVRVGPTLRHLRGYLQTMPPPLGHEKLLWKLLEENDVQNVVVVSALKVSLVGEKGTKEKYGDVMVTTTGQTQLDSDLTLVTLQLQVPNEDHSRNIRFFKLSGSPHMDSMSSRLLDHTHLQHLSIENTPVVIIHSETDRKYAVMLCIMGNILSGILEDKCVDVIGHVRTFLKCCPELRFTEKDAVKLHEFAQKSVEMTGTESTYANL